jgi:hypothetical protein
MYGYASSPIAFRDTVIVPVGGPGKAVMAFRQADGGVAWAKNDFGNAYSSPVLINVDGLDQLAGVMDGAVFGVNPHNGDLQWQAPFRAAYGISVASPVWGPGNLLFVSAEYDAGAKVIELQNLGRRAGSGDDRLGVGVGHVCHGVSLSPVQGAAGPLGMAPLGARNVGPPVVDVTEVDGARRRVEYERAWDQQPWVRVRVGGRVRGPFRGRDMAGRLYEPPELGDGDQVLVDPERPNRLLVDRTLFLVELLRAHQEGTAGHLHHVLRCRAHSS